MANKGGHAPFLIGSGEIAQNFSGRGSMPFSYFVRISPNLRQTLPESHRFANCFFEKKEKLDGQPMRAAYWQRVNAMSAADS